MASFGAFLTFIAGISRTILVTPVGPCRFRSFSRSHANMTTEETKNVSTGAGDYDAKVAPQIASTSDDSSFTDRRGPVKSDDCAFDTTEDPRYYKPIPEYEGIHRWDPDFDWTEEEEKAVVKKVCRTHPIAIF